MKTSSKSLSARPFPPSSEPGAPSLLGRVKKWWGDHKPGEEVGASSLPPDDRAASSSHDARRHHRASRDEGAHDERVSVSPRREADSSLFGSSELSLVGVQFELRRLLARHPHARKVAPHLAYVLRTLKQDDDFTALRAAPPAVARQALSQLDLLTRSRSPSLMLLRTELIAIVEAPPRAAPGQKAPGDVSTSVLLIEEDEELTSSMLITESSIDEFLAEQQNWQVTQRDSDVPNLAATVPDKSL